MRSEPLAATAALIILGFTVFGNGCGDETGGQELTTVASGPVGSGGMMNTGGGGGAGANGGGGTGGNPTGGGMGGQGGTPETPIHGCLSGTATDMTMMATIDLGDPTQLSWPLCYTVSLNTVMTVGNDGNPQVADFLIVGGTYDGVIKAYDASSPIQPSCATGCNPCQFDPNAAGCYTGGSWTFALAGVYPFYNNTAPDVNAGVIYVVP